MSEPCPTERPLLTRARIGVLMGGQSAERDVSLRTGTAVHRSLVRRGYNAVAIDVGPTLARDLQEKKIELAFLALHGPGGEDGAIQGFLETLGIPYTGSGIQPVRSACTKSPRRLFWPRPIFLYRPARL